MVIYLLLVVFQIVAWYVTRDNWIITGSVITFFMVAPIFLFIFKNK